MSPGKLCSGVEVSPGDGRGDGAQVALTGLLCEAGVAPSGLLQQTPDPVRSGTRRPEGGRSEAGPENCGRMRGFAPAKPGLWPRKILC